MIQSFNLRDENRELFNSHVLERIRIKTNSKIYSTELTFNGCIIAIDNNPMNLPCEEGIMIEPKLYLTENGTLDLLGKLLEYTNVILNIVYKSHPHSKIELFPVWKGLISEDKDKTYDKAVRIFNQKSFPESMLDYYKYGKKFFEWKPNNILRYSGGTAGLLYKIEN